jgi:hypothetical protein
MMTQVAMCEDHPVYRKGQQHQLDTVAWLKSTNIADEADYQGGITVPLRMMSNI